MNKYKGNKTIIIKTLSFITMLFILFHNNDSLNNIDEAISENTSDISIFADEPWEDTRN